MSPTPVSVVPLFGAAAVPSQDLLGSVFRHALAPMVITDTQGVICHANAAFERATGHSADQLLGQRPSLMKSDLQSPDFYRRMWAALHAEGRWQGEIWNRSRDGQVFREWLSIVALPDPCGTVRHYLGMYSGLSSPHLAAAHGDEVGGIDSVTGVLTRRAFLTAAARLSAERGSVAMIVLDIDGFTDLNEHHGLRTGDNVLRQVALRCLHAITEHGGRSVLGRVGSDEFALAWTTEHAGREAEADRIQCAADALRQAACGVYEIEPGRSLSLEVSVGVSLMSGGQDAADALLHASAARQASPAQAGAVQHYAQLDAHRRLVRALREDVMADQIRVAFQPKVDLASGRLVGLEALARWTGPDGQPVPPSVFIGLAERNGLIADLGDRVFERVLRLLAQWRAEGLEVVPVAVNFSAPQFQRPDLAARVQAALRRHQLPARLLEIELTESILLHDFESALHTLNTLREVGVGLSIDDFGTGYSSLAYLRRFPVQRLKIDRSFVQDLETDARTREIVDTVIRLAHRFDMSCIAEGIETPRQRELLHTLGCDQGQGYLFDRPLCEEHVRSHLAQPHRWA